ncbi:acyl-[acyl-carrier-protein]--UDP-N-acetylglucosamine O-acyltransferase [Maritimibacter sp. 55A14]|uniref:acyl-ACP--UDP-N-acetylglucosamine O-acyltransferase n=1 Tax=Maritimibacter sp. 55A14 TaxID=2174844 RepID=UPI000D610FA8|nr:acyl-ACP--UDP-N-acetylglucosamine O-acyltransferase [Maritimibacter sp. 55A14]PWE34288.1 acyl-[acyl-carrier-protein]--UDP-N-acetylglucosamine O-acyltransferase [Maritimibacter sp. 55A14]
MAIHPSAQIHGAAIVEDGAEIGADCRIGPFSVIGPDVRLAAGVEVKSHAVVTGHTSIGEGTVIFPFACVGEVPQDLKYKGEASRLEVGRRVRIREGATLNTGTEGGGRVTRVGDDCLLMTGAHVGHDAQVGSSVILANDVALAGHCVIGDGVVIGGLSGIHQFVRVGKGAIVGAVTMVTHDVIPYGLVQGPRGRLDGLNLVGLKRRGLSRAEIAELRAAYRALATGEGSFQDRAAKLEAAGSGNAHLREMIAFILGGSERSFLTPR